jgi:hypothetical protein
LRQDPQPGVPNYPGNPTQCAGVENPAQFIRFFLKFFSTTKSVPAWAAFVTAKFNPNEKAHMKTGNGKIANLPAQIRDELNCRIADGDEGIELVEWLNSKPEVAEVVNKLFDGTPISEQNLSQWRKRGYQKWLAHRNMFDESNALGDNAEEIAETGIDCDKLLLTLTAAYAECTSRSASWTVAERQLHGSRSFNRSRIGSSRRASKCSASWPFTKNSPTA